MTTYTPTYRKQPTLEQIGKSLVADHRKRVAALAEEYPCTVTLEHFVRRDLGAAIEAGRCTVTMGHRIFGSSLPRVTISDVRYADKCYAITTTVGREWETYYGQETLEVIWHDFGDTWKKLSPAMRRGLRYLAGEKERKPRRSTLKALESRGHILNDVITSVALELYRQHRKEITDVR